MEFKVGDRVKIVDDERIFTFSDGYATSLNLTKWRLGYGKWEENNCRGEAQDKEGVIISILETPDYNLAGVEIDNEEVQIVIEVTGLELLEAELKFKVGDRVKIVDDRCLWIAQEDMAEKLNLTKWKCGYGAWYKNAFPEAIAEVIAGEAQNKEGVIVAMDGSNFPSSIAGVEIDNEEVQIVIEVTGLELLEAELKFKVGDVVRYEDSTKFRYRVVQIAEKGEVVKGPWMSGDEEFEVSERAYILANDCGQWSYSSVVECALELVEIEEKPLKFRVGDVIQYSDHLEKQTIMKIAEKGEIVKGPWTYRHDEIEMAEKSYILEVESGNWRYCYVHDPSVCEYKLVNTEEEPSKELERDQMNQCINCVEANPQNVGDFYEGGNTLVKKLVWCKEKNAWVSQDRVEICFKKPSIPCKACGAFFYLWVGFHEKGCEDSIQARCSANISCGVRAPYKQTEEDAREAWEKLNKV